MTDLSTITFDEIFNALKKTFRYRHNESVNFFSEKTSQEHVKQLIEKCEEIGRPSIPPESMIEKYKQQWINYCNNKSYALERHAIRYLCYSPEIATDRYFLSYLQSNQEDMKPNSLKGIVRAAHLKWSYVMQESLFKKTSLLEQVRSFVKNYDGKDRALIKWQENLDMILSQKAPELFASEMVKDNKTIKSHTEYWAVDDLSEFFHEAITEAVIVCRTQIRDDINKCDYLFSELFSYKAWQVSFFKEGIGKTILDKCMDNNTVRESLLVFIQRDNRLGDPRLPINNLNWIGIDDEARDRVIQWFSKEDIVFFFQHVLPDRKDPHGRKEFWLKYVHKLKASRPLLCFNDEVRLQYLLIKDKTKVSHFGKIRGVNSAFLLDFGEIIAVEFSRVGAIYLYTASNFKKIVPDFWTNQSFNETGLKNKALCIDDPVRHITTYNVNWRKKVGNILAQYGIRFIK